MYSRFDLLKQLYQKSEDYLKKIEQASQLKPNDEQHEQQLEKLKQIKKDLEQTKEIIVQNLVQDDEQIDTLTQLSQELSQHSRVYHLNLPSSSLSDDIPLSIQAELCFFTVGALATLYILLFW